MAARQERAPTWSGAPDLSTSEQVHTTIELKSLAARDPQPNAKDVVAMMQAAIGDNGYAHQVTNDNGKPVGALYEVQFYTVEARQEFEARLANHRKQESAVVGPKKYTAIGQPSNELALKA